MTPTTGMTIGHIRVSTLHQDQTPQRNALEAAGRERLLVDKTSDALSHRPELDSMLETLRPGDTVVEWRLDRLGRSLRHLITLVADPEERGVQLRSLTEQADTTTPAGRLTFHVFAATGEFEREAHPRTHHRRTARCPSTGPRGGRPTVWTPEKLATARAMHAAGQDVASIARVLGVSRASVYRGLLQDQSAAWGA